jgi:hypothetical protein
MDARACLEQACSWKNVNGILLPQAYPEIVAPCGPRSFQNHQKANPPCQTNEIRIDSPTPVRECAIAPSARSAISDQRG